MLGASLKARVAPATILCREQLD